MHSILHIGKDNPKNNYMIGHTPLQVVEKERDWEWLFQLVITFVGRNKYEELLEKQNKIMMSWIIRNVVSRKPEVLICCAGGMRSAGVGPNHKTRKMGYYNGN